MSRPSPHPLAGDRARARLPQGKRRARRRRGQDGATLFIVSMTLAALASVGVYALAAAASEVRTSGYERQNTQTHFLATYGVLGTAHEITASKGQLYMGLMQSMPDAPCVALPNVPSTASILTRACRRLPATEVGMGWQGGTNIVDAYAGTVPYQSGVTPGSFGPTPTQGDFFVELTDLAQAAPPARYGLNLNFCFVQMTASASGITRPLFPSNPNWTQTFGSESVETQRARLLVGPVQCPR